MQRKRHEAKLAAQGARASPLQRRSFAASGAPSIACVDRRVPTMNCREILLRPVMTAIALGAAALLSDPAFAADAAAPRTLTVSGEGEAKAVPDEAHLSAGVVTQAKKAAEALAANTRAM